MTTSDNEYCNDPKCEITREGIPHNHSSIAKSDILSKDTTDYFIYVNGEIRDKSRSLLGKIKYRYSPEDFALYNADDIKILSVKLSWISVHKWKVSLDFQDMTVTQKEKNKSSTFTLKNKQNEIILKTNFEGNEGEILNNNDELIAKSAEFNPDGELPVIHYQILKDLEDRSLLLGLLTCHYLVFIAPYEGQEGG